MPEPIAVLLCYDAADGADWLSQHPDAGAMKVVPVTFAPYYLAGFVASSVRHTMLAEADPKFGEVYARVTFSIATRTEL